MEKLSFAVDTATTMAYMHTGQANTSTVPSAAGGLISQEAKPEAGSRRGPDQDPISRPYLAWAVQVSGGHGLLRRLMMPEIG